MNNLALLFFGIFSVVASSWVGLVWTAHVQYGDLQPSTQQLDEETGAFLSGEPFFPRQFLGLAEQGKQTYITLGCAVCHTQQVRQPGLWSDYTRGYGERPSVARDYIRQERVLTGFLRVGPDLANVGKRRDDPQWYYRYLYNPASVVEGSTKPHYPFLFEQRSDRDSSKPVRPGPRAEALVAYLLSLRQDYDLPEAQRSDWQKKPSRPDQEMHH